MTKTYLTIIALSWLLIAGMAHPAYMWERIQLANTVSKWPELKTVQRDHNSVSVNVASFEKVSMPPIKGINDE